MAYARGRYGVEYTPQRRPETPRFRGFVICLVVLALASFAVTKTVRYVRNRPGKGRTGSPAAMQAPAGTPVARPPSAPADRASRKPAVSPRPAVTGAAKSSTGGDQPPAVPPAPRPVVLSKAAQMAEQWLLRAQGRSAGERVLLEKLAAAERQNEYRNAIDAIEKLSARPAMADLKGKLENRLGELNLQYLFTGSNTPWTVTIKVRRGDSHDRIAREHRMTGTALEKLNPRTNWERIKPGDAIRVLDYPTPVLVIHKKLGFADLSLLKSGKFFRRYIISPVPAASAGVYPVEAGTTARMRLKELVRAITPRDRSELEMFLAPGSRITVTDL